MVDRARRRLGLAALLASAWPAWAAVAPTLRLGVMPIYGVRTLMQRYEPVRGHAARLLGQPVRLETAPDFKRYLASILAGEFDIAIVAAHFARIAQLDAGWLPLVQFAPGHDATLITRAGEASRGLADLAGRELAVIDRLAITVMGALHHIEGNGLVADRDYRVVEYRNHTSVVHSLLSGASAMAVTTGHGLRQIPPELRARLAVYRSLPEIPAFVVMAAPALPPPDRERLRSGLLAWAQSREGQSFLAGISYRSAHAADERAMRRADVYLKETRRMLERG